MNVEDSSKDHFRMCLQTVVYKHFEEASLCRLRYIWGISYIWNSVSFFNENIEIPQMVLLALVTITEFGPKAL